jgi:hypothetical protein
MMQWSLGGRRVRMDVCKELALSDVVVASTAGTTKFMRIFTLKIAWRFDGGDGFYGMCMRYSLSIY